MKFDQKIRKTQERDEALQLYYNKGLTNAEIAKILGISTRTVIRWKQSQKDGHSSVYQKSDHKRKRKKKYPDVIFERILELKKEMPARSASGIHRILSQELPAGSPSISTVRKFLHAEGYSPQKSVRREGYIKFERGKPNDLWQIDIAGVQTVGTLGKLYLIAILDDCSRFIVSVQYFPSQIGVNVLSVIRNALMGYGCPNQIIADNGSQFRNVTKELGNRYTRLLTSLDIEPIYSKPYHPQSKGKLERWFGTVRQMFLPEGRLEVQKNPEMYLHEFNALFRTWLEWYNYKKPHRSLPGRGAPAQRYFNHPERIYRPLTAQVDWNKWIHTYVQRKVTKYNRLSYKGEKIDIPPGYAGCRLDLLELEDMIEIYFHEDNVCSYQKQPLEIRPGGRKNIRTIAQSGTVRYRTQVYTVDYKLAGKKVEIKESADGQELLVYLNKVLIKRLSRK